MCKDHEDYHCDYDYDDDYDYDYEKAFVQVVHCLKQRWKDDGVIACRGKEIATVCWPGGGGDNPHGDGGGLTCW